MSKCRRITERGETAARKRSLLENYVREDNEYEQEDIFRYDFVGDVDGYSL